MSFDLRRTDSPSPADSSADQHAGDDGPLSPPHPSFLAGSRKNSDKGAWSSPVGKSVESASDSDNTNCEAAAVATAT